ncbi:MAG: flagellar basal body-associated FliL family protein [Armatimonadetes bacterium]|nr:flagellar basal body-associated FliL family protein [Armatimonadota bacterium]MBS1712633.1 flagellar basal body-associated FliL family protein [Armatimonadota bacterium]MBX3109928.1 flagellar basal body-associated FliL family protein [Fimbriimonadaceae bacterium]
MAEKAKKKGGKLPIILVAVLVVAGGGFFAMGKKEAPKKKEEPEVKLGAVQSLGGEFLINLKDGSTFLNAEISVQLDAKGHITDPVAGGEGGGEHGGKTEATFSIARDAVNMVLAGKSIEDLTKPGGLKILKHEIAAAINHAVHPPEEPTAEEKKKQEHEAKNGKGHEEGIDHEWLNELGRDSEKGPVLKVFFDKFMYSRV